MSLPAPVDTFSSMNDGWHLWQCCEQIHSGDDDDDADAQLGTQRFHLTEASVKVKSSIWMRIRHVCILVLLNINRLEVLYCAHKSDMKTA